MKQKKEQSHLDEIQHQNSITSFMFLIILIYDKIICLFWCLLKTNLFKENEKHRLQSHKMITQFVCVLNILTLHLIVIYYLVSATRFKHIFRLSFSSFFFSSIRSEQIITIERQTFCIHAMQCILITSPFT